MNKDIENLKNILVDLEDAENGAIINLSQEEINSLKTILNLTEKQQKEIEDYKKFKKDIVSKIMFWDKEGLPEDEVIIRMLDTLMDEVSRLEDIEDKKVEVAVNFIEEKRDKFWQDKIREKIKDYTEKSKYPLVNSQSRREYTFGLKALIELLEEK